MPTKVHWGGNKEEGGAYLIAGIGPGDSVEVPKNNGPWAGGDPSAATVVLPDQIPWKDHGVLPDCEPGWRSGQAGPLCADAHVAQGQRGFSRPHFHPNDRYVTFVISGTWWVGTGNKFDPLIARSPCPPARTSRTTPNRSTTMAPRTKT